LLCRRLDLLLLLLNLLGNDLGKCNLGFDLLLPAFLGKSFFRLLLNLKL
jgi:hypothetical protein